MAKLSLILLAAFASAGVYLHNPRGSNNRHNSANDNVQNGQRMFNSQNDPRGGYNVGDPMYYYIGSKLEIEWTMQHGCVGAEGKVDCNVVLQYMCSPMLRDGLTDSTISQSTASTMTGSSYQYGMHEDWNYYSDCSTRWANGGLWIADRMLSGSTAIYTRQNEQGARYGFECPEERDYYPYWHPTPWKDIAVYTSDTTRCDYYQLNSQNTAQKGYCSGFPQYPDEINCPSGSWMTGYSFDLPSPDCLEVPFTRANHLGNTLTGYPIRYSWTIPRVPADSAKNCALRIRYNISSAEVDWNLDSTSNEDDFTSGTYFKATGVNSPVIRNPYVPFNGVNISYAIDSASYGKTFQDRSHTFEIRERPAGVNNAIYNLNVRGKRGNIVETFPAVEYDFVPDVLVMNKNEWLHPQWTGTDQNTANAAGEGLDQTDRTNIVQMRSLTENYPLALNEQTLFTKEEAMRIGSGGMIYYGSLCKSLTALLTSNANDNDIEEDPYNCGKLNMGGPYFDGGLQPMRIPGTYYYMSSRNNNFTNRSQKGTIIVNDCSTEQCRWEDVAVALNENGAAALAASVALANLL